MAEESFQERTEPATPQRKEEARNKGRVAQSRDLVLVLGMLSVIGTFYLYGDTLISKSADLIGHWIREAATPTSLDGEAGYVLREIILNALTILWPILLAGFAVTILSHIGQVGFIFVSDPLMPDLSRIDPLSGLSRIFSVRNLVEFVKALIKFAIIGVVGFSQFMKIARNARGWIELSVKEQMKVGGQALGTVILTLGIILLLLAIIDYFFQRFEFERQMRMTKQEVKEELKLREGDPLIRARIRSIQRERARKRMMKDVEKADVIVTNPTHFAIALRYKQDSMDAPRVVAKGAEFLAERIKEIARRHSIPIVENKPLARILYRTVKVGQFIPRELYHAVAEVLAYVYKLRRRMGRGVQL